MEGEKKYEEDNSLKAKILGPELCIKNFIDNEPLCNYELYLLEFVNSSDFFSKKSDGEKYSRPVVNLMVNVIVFRENIKWILS